MTLMRQRSPSPLSFHPTEDGIDDLDIILIKNIEMRPGITVKELASRMVFFNKDDPTEEQRASYAQIWWRISTLEKEGMISTQKEPNHKGMTRRCYKSND